MYKIYNHKLLVLVAAMICTFSLSAQIEVTVTTSDGTEFGPYSAFTAGFGPIFDVCGGSLEGPIELASDITGSSLACDSIAQDLTGKIAIIDRGTCAFVTKVYGAQVAGAIGVLIISDDRAAGALGGDDERITIPSFMIENAEGAEFRDMIEGASVSIGTEQAEFDSRDIVLWGANGEGGFDGGLNGWITENYTACAADSAGFSLWQWSESTGANRGAYVGGAGNVNSPTACNGVITFDSDFYDNNGVAGDFGLGPCSASQAGAITSPAIDLSGSPDVAGVAITFYQALRQFQSSYFVGWSLDGGITWDSTQINQEYPVNSPNIQDIERVNLPSEAIGVSDLRIRFTMAPANYYYWTIDDVRIVEREANNLRVNEFFALPPNAITPQSQVEAFGFLADIENIGALAQDDVSLNVTIFNTADESIVYTNDLAYGTITSDSLAENQAFDGTFAPTEIGLYQGFYTISSPNDDFDEGDNQQSFFFFISDTTFAKEYALEGGNDLGGILVDFDVNPTWAYGQHFYVPNGDGYQVTSVTLGVSNPAEVAGLTIIAAIFEWADANEDGVAQGDERILIGFREYEIQETDVADAPINIAFNDVEGEEIFLKDDTEYLVMNVANGPITITSSIGTFDYSATSLLTTEAGTPRYGGFIGLSNDLAAEDYTPVGGAQQFVPFVRMNINTTPTNLEETLTEEHEIKVYPNPATTQLTLDLDLQEVSKDVRLRVFDMTGRLVSRTRLENISSQEFTFNTANLQSGVYVMEITTDFGVRTVQFEIAE